jgi:hypothetical protein
LSTLAPSYVLSTGLTLGVDVDGLGALACTFTGVRAAYSGTAGTFASSAGSVLLCAVDNGHTQTLNFTASEDTIDKYVTKINDQLLDGFVQADQYALDSMMIYLNELKTKYNLHMASTTYHDIADANTAAGTASDLATATALANSIRTNYKLHLIAASEVEEAVTLLNQAAAKYELHRVMAADHVAIDNTNVVNAALYPCTDFATAAALAAELKTKYNAHLILAGVHINNDGVDTITATTPVTTEVLLKAFANQFIVKFNAHLIVIDETTECVTLVNNLYNMYNGHINLLTSHLIADAVNTLNPAHYPATDLASATTLANDIRTAYKAHRSQAGVHTNNDAGNDIASGAAGGTLAALVTLVNQEKVALNAHEIAASEVEEAIALISDLMDKYELHRVKTAGAVHGSADATDALASIVHPTDLATCITRVNDLKNKYNAHRMNVTGAPAIHGGGGDNLNAVILLDATDFNSMKALANDIRTKQNAHVVLVAAPAAHGGADAGDQTAVVAIGTAGIHIGDDVTDTVTAATAGTAAIHYVTDTTNTMTAPAVGTAAIHLTDDTVNDITVGAAGGTLADLQALVADLYLKYPLHIASTTYHKVTDAVDVVTAVPHLLTFVSNTKGKYSKFEVLVGSTAGLLTKLGLAIGSATGVSGSNVNDIEAVTFAEIKTLLELANANCLVTSDDGYVRVTSNRTTTGVSSSVVMSGTARTIIGFDASTHDGADADANQYVTAEYITSYAVAANAMQTPKLIVRANDVVSVRIASQTGPTTLSIEATPVVTP